MSSRWANNGDFVSNKYSFIYSARERNERKCRAKTIPRHEQTISWYLIEYV